MFSVIEELVLIVRTKEQLISIVEMMNENIDFIKKMEELKK